MLQKSKSAKRAKLKYLVLIPVLLLMLTYVSCEQDNAVFEEDKQEELADIPEADKILIEELRQKIQKMDENGASWDEITNTFFTEKDELIKSRKAYYSFHVYMEWIIENNIERKKKEGTYDPESDTLNLPLKSYKDYVTYRKTQEPKKKMKSVNQSSIPFTKIDKAPTFTSCNQDASNEELRKCTSKWISEFVNENFDVEKAKAYADKGVNRVYVRFIISKTGTVKDVEARAAHPVLRDEAIRVIKKLPQMIPGEQDGKPVGVAYSLPIIFQVD